MTTGSSMRIIPAIYGVIGAVSCQGLDNRIILWSEYTGFGEDIAVKEVCGKMFQGLNTTSGGSVRIGDNSY
jgi:hypothetical protein